MELLILRLEGMLQSWGEQAKWDERDTAYFPTKSGVVGLLACCLGYERGDARTEKLSDELFISVRADRAGKLMTDFHTVQGSPAVMNAEGKPRGGGRTFITRRAYLQDASFLVVISGSSATLKLCAEALRNPMWTPFLGRRSCTPSMPIFLELTGRFDNDEDAIRNYPRVARSDTRTLYQLERTDGEGTRTDRLMASADRIFSTRRVSAIGVLEEAKS